MNLNLSFAVIALLITAVAVAPIGSAYAANKATVEEGRKQLSPKTFGEKTKIALINADVDKNHKAKFDGAKKEQVKIYKKLVEQHKALDFAKKYYIKL
ncbi:hypothetical protein C6988_10795, partial [Nitrosopumilus sp. b1]|uniref:hypothetical protein n=1 Tax=Nitrosopumilus sp. b1 TaxID=2109907 RepID=UPI0015F4947D